MDSDRLNSKEFITYLEKIQKLYESDILTFAEYTRKKGNIINDLKERDLSEKEEDFMLNISGLYKSNVINDEELILIKNIVFIDKDNLEPAIPQQKEAVNHKQSEISSPQHIETVINQQIASVSVQNKIKTKIPGTELSQNNIKKAKNTSKISLIIISISIIIVIIAVIIKRMQENETSKTEQIGNNITSRITDIDSNVYKTVTIGTQEWMAENLNVEHYRNGDVIPQVQDKDKWSNLTTGAWCYYDNDPAKGKTYGKLYNWYAVNDPRVLAPEGWHVPSDKEWTKLTDYLGGESVAGGKMKATTLWNSPNTGATNESGFTAFPSGVRDDIGYYNYIGEDGFIWSASEATDGTAWTYGLYFNGSGVFRGNYSKRRGSSVGCVKD